MSETELQFLFLDDDIDEHYLFRSDLKRTAPFAALECFESWDQLEQFIQSKSFQSKPSVLLLDLNMPAVSGHEVIKRIRTDQRFNTLPIVVFTTSRSDEDVQRSYALGANSFITKPSDRDEAKSITTQLANYWAHCVKLPRFRRLVT